MRCPICDVEHDGEGDWCDDCHRDFTDPEYLVMDKYDAAQWAAKRAREAKR